MSLPSLPLFPADYFGDTKHLSCEQHGAYLQLLMIAWKLGGALPDDDVQLARMVSLPLKRWRSIKPVIMAFWHKNEEGQWAQKRLLQELSWVNSRIELRRDAGKRGGRPKSLENKERPKAKGSENGVETESKTKAPNPNPIKKDTTSVVSDARAMPVGWHPDFEDRSFARKRGFNDIQVDEEAQRFRDTNLAKGTLIHDVKAAWRSWLTSPFAPHNRPASERQRPPPIKNGNVARLLTLERERREDEHTHDAGPPAIGAHPGFVDHCPQADEQDGGNPRLIPDDGDREERRAIRC